MGTKSVNYRKRALFLWAGHVTGTLTNNFWESPSKVFASQLRTINFIIRSNLIKLKTVNCLVSSTFVQYKAKGIKVVECLGVF